MTLTISKLKLDPDTTLIIESDRPLTEADRETICEALNGLGKIAYGTEFALKSGVQGRVKRRSWLSAIRERIQKFAKS